MTPEVVIAASHFCAAAIVKTEIYSREGLDMRRISGSSKSSRVVGLHRPRQRSGPLRPTDGHDEAA